MAGFTVKKKKDLKLMKDLTKKEKPGLAYRIETAGKWIAREYPIVSNNSIAS